MASSFARVWGRLAASPLNFGLQSSRLIRSISVRTEAQEMQQSEVKMAQKITSAVSVIRDCSAESGYFRFRGISYGTVLYLDSKLRSAGIGNCRLGFYGGVLTVKYITSKIHDGTGNTFMDDILVKLRQIPGHDDPDDRKWLLTGSAAFGDDEEMLKQGDAGFFPASRGREGYPSLVIEVGSSQSMADLRVDAQEWIGMSSSRPNLEVKVVLLISVWKPQQKLKRMYFEIWKRSSDDTAKMVQRVTLQGDGVVKKEEEEEVILDEEDVPQGDGVMRKCEVILEDKDIALEFQYDWLFDESSPHQRPIVFTARELVQFGKLIAKLANVE